MMRTPLLAIAGLLLGSAEMRMAAGAGAPATDARGPYRIYTALLEPREHPDYTRRAVRPPSWDTFGGRTRFTVLRGFAMADGKAVGYAEEMEKYSITYRLGEVVWPSYDLIFAANLGDVAEEIRRRNLFLFDIWGYVPGSGPGGYWQQFHAPPGVFELIEAKLGERWLGMDIGEQDGRYIGGYASQMVPISANRFEQYLNFQRHFERMTDELGNKHSTLVSLTFGHYFLKEGVYATIGAETAQGLPNGQVYYCFIRGAGKQYGVPWFGNASVWNRWGYKSYDGEGPDHGPTRGTSLSLLRRLIYSHILYNCVFAGFEAGWFSGGGLSPIGRIQQAAAEWVEAHGQPGAMLTPVALLLDFYSGWTVPRHLYTDKVYRVWGNIPYGPGDYLTEGVLDLLYPGYQDASFYHDESGFLAATPYGDAADCLLSDAPLWVLERYPVLVVAGEVAGGAELGAKLQAYAERGGTVAITAGNLARLPGGLGGIACAGPAERFAAGVAVERDGENVAEPHPFSLTPLLLPPAARVRARCGAAPALAEVSCGKGAIIVLASAMGIADAPAVDGPTPSREDQPLARPYPLLAHVRQALDALFRRQMLFDAGRGLSLITCRRGPGEYTLGIANNALEPRPFKIVSRCGDVMGIEELAVDQAAKRAVGYLPTGMEGADVGTSDAGTIAGGDVRLWRVRVREEGVLEIPHTAPPGRPRGRALPLRGGRTIKEQILSRPTFFEWFDGAAVDWRYVNERDAAALEREAGWIARQGLRLYVDLSSGLNLFPDLRLVNNDEREFAASMAAIDGVLAKMSALGARDLILSLHRDPENNFTREQTLASFESTLRVLCARAGERGITLCLRMSAKSVALDALARLADAVGAPNLKLAPSLALLIDSGTPPAAVAALGARLGLWLVAAPARDTNGATWTTHVPLAASAGALEKARPFLDAAPELPMLLDAVYDEPDAEYRDAALTPAKREPPAVEPPLPAS